MSHLDRYDFLWQLLGIDGRTTALLGERCAPLARQAFASSACGAATPVVYFEIPLAGEPGFDLQVCIDRSSLLKGFHLPENAPAREQELLTWLAGPGGVGCAGVDLAFDLRDRGIESPQLIVLMNKGILEDAEGFFALAGVPDGAQRYRTAESKTPDGWASWYTGVIPGRPGAPVRLDYFVSDDKARTYANDASLLACDLNLMGYAPSGCEIGWCERLLQLSCSLNLQLDANDDGGIGPVLGYNLNEGGIGPQAVRQRLESGWMREALTMAEAWGIADERWRLLGDLCQARMLVSRSKTGTETRIAVTSKVTFIKIRMSQDALIDAKAYVMCNFFDLDKG